ncbi:hypothetical protein N0V93_002640 [Gnomoniopsis smithogilvyi]|uniref:Uncharacterized protein n=1 Tax=Gnomoniopsis smithogilvyi TaxID=1191159 RepID=A0A9W9CXU8_9PEZI|nr:hypothetical protein N0V93_002640 [Gnomoniopsis smithogilvyi]
MYPRNFEKRQNNIELQDLEPCAGDGSHSVPLDLHDPVDIGGEIYRDKQAQLQRQRQCIIFLAVLVALLAVSSIALGVRFVRPAKPPDTQTLTTVAPTTEYSTKLVTRLRTTTDISIQPTIETVISTQTDTTTQRAKASSVTAFITTTLYLTSTQTTNVPVSSTITPSLAARCIPPGLYGGEELHLLSSDYDIIIASSLYYATSQGLDIGNEDLFLEALRSIFTCVAEDDLVLVAACQKAYSRANSTMSCDGPEFSFPASTLSSTVSTWTSSSTLPDVIPTEIDTSSITPVTMTKTTDVDVPWTPGPSRRSISYERDNGLQAVTE